MIAITTTYSAMELSDLTAALNAEHSRATRSARTTIDHATRCGEMLLEAKARLPHGQWESWLEENTEVSPRTSQRYMRLASNTTSVSLLDGDMGIVEALEMISTPAAPKLDPVGNPKASKPTSSIVDAEIMESEAQASTPDSALTEKESNRLAELESIIEAGVKKCPNMFNANSDDGDPIDPAEPLLIYIKDQLPDEAPDPIYHAVDRLIYVLIKIRATPEYIRSLADAVLTLERKDSPKP